MRLKIELQKPSHVLLIHMIVMGVVFSLHSLVKVNMYDFTLLSTIVILSYQAIFYEALDNKLNRISDRLDGKAYILISNKKYPDRVRELPITLTRREFSVLGISQALAIFADGPISATIVSEIAEKHAKNLKMISSGDQSYIVTIELPDFLYKKIVENLPAEKTQ